MNSKGGRGSGEGMEKTRGRKDGLTAGWCIWERFVVVGARCSMR